MLVSARRSRFITLVTPRTRTSWLFSILYRKIVEARRKAGREQAMEDIDSVFEQKFDTNGSWIQPPRPVDSALDPESRSAVCD